MKYRQEKDSIGLLDIPFDAYYGINALRASQNFKISGNSLNSEYIQSVVKIKKAAALTNLKAGKLNKEKAEAIIKACDEIIEGRLLDQFIVDPLQGGAGTSVNMNANEVIANRALEILGKEKGSYDIVHPNDHVNLAQSTNDVIPSAIKITSLLLINELEESLRKLFASLLDKSTEFMDVIKIGRTQMQDAVPITLGQEFFAYADAVRRGIEVIDSSKALLSSINMGGTAIGTSINADETYTKNIVAEISKVTGLDLKQSDNLIDSTQNIDAFVAVSGSIKSCAVALSKIASDLRLLSSSASSGFGEIILPSMQNGSSIMPAKINPIIPEIINQVCFLVMGNDETIAIAAESGQLELNAFLPVLSYRLFESLTTMTNAITSFRVNCVDGVVANTEKCLENLNRGVGVVTALCPYIGYEAAATVAKTAVAKKKTVKEIVLEMKLLEEDKLEEILNPKNLV